MTASVSVRRQKVRKNHTKKRLFFFLLLTALLMFVVIFAEQICPYDPNAQVFTTLEPPSAAHPAGTDRLGRDLLSRILVGLQTSVVSTLTLVVIITAAGTAIGVVCGRLGGVVDSLMMREVGGQAVLGRQIGNSSPWLTERHGYDPTWF